MQSFVFMPAWFRSSWQKTEKSWHGRSFTLILTCFLVLVKILIGHAWCHYKCKISQIIVRRNTEVGVKTAPCKTPWVVESSEVSPPLQRSGGWQLEAGFFQYEESGCQIIFTCDRASRSSYDAIVIFSLFTCWGASRSRCVAFIFSFFSTSS